MAAMALTVIALMTACKQKTAEEPIDTMVDDTTLTIEEPVEDTIINEEVAEPIKEEAKATKKAEAKPVDPVRKAADKTMKNEGTVTLTKADGTKTEAAAATPKDVKLQKADNSDSKAITTKKGNVEIKTKGK